MNDDEDEDYNGFDNNIFLSHNYSTRNIFNERKNIKNEFDEYYNEWNPNQKLNGNQRGHRNNDYFDYDGYEGFNCFPCERKQKIKNLEIDELNNDLNILLKRKNIMENNLLKLPGQSKSLNHMRQKKELNNQLKQTENQINEIRVRIKQLKGL